MAADYQGDGWTIHLVAPVPPATYPTLAATHDRCGRKWLLNEPFVDDKNGPNLSMAVLALRMSHTPACWLDAWKEV